jgi:hypothetical protein
MFRKFAAALLCCIALPASANTFMTDASDLWWNPNESGWGVNIVHQADKIFATLFVYSSARQPRWYVAPDMSHVEGVTFRGELYETEGPWFGGPFNPGAVSVRRVGNATFRFDAASLAAFSYSVDGVAVNKTLTRQTLRANNLAGSYVGTMVGTYSGCGVDGYAEDPVLMQIDHVDPSISIQTSFNDETCTYRGSYAQSGRMGRIEATIDCGNGDIGPFVATEIEATTTLVGGKATAHYGSCRWEGRFGVVRRASDPGS